MYWAVIDAAHALIMHAGEEPTHPKATPTLFRKVAKTFKLSPNLSLTIDKFIVLMKEITKGKRKSFTGSQVDALRRKAETFVNAIKRVIE